MGGEWFLDVLLKQKVTVGSAHPTYFEQKQRVNAPIALLRAEAESQRADRLANRLRSMGINP